jgi:hypothetical protein
MAKSPTINALNEALRILGLEDARKADINLSAKEMKLILSLPEDALESPLEKRKELIDKLFESLSTPSFGELIATSMKEKKLTKGKLEKKTRLPDTVLKQLKSDAIFPSNVPIKLLRNLVDCLELTYATTEKAILRTFEMLCKDEWDHLKAAPLRVVARKNRDEAEDLFMNKEGEPDGRELYENRETLNKYLAQLKELMAG